LTTGDCTTTHSYDENGVFYVSASVEEMGRFNPQTAKQTIGVLVYGSGINIFSVIDEPKGGSISQTGFVNFSANSSYVSNCTSAKSCIFPSVFLDVEKNCYPVGNLNCFDYPDRIFDGKNYELYYNWTFSEGEGLFGAFSEKKSSLVSFIRYFNEAKKHWAKLKIGFERLK
jgi:hypothetical protein